MIAAALQASAPLFIGTVFVLGLLVGPGGVSIFT